MADEIKDGGPAFPVETTSTPWAPGMSLRDWFAGQALALLSHPQNDVDPTRNAVWAYEIADAMLKAREASQ